MDCIVPIRDSREFKRGQTKYMHCIEPSESRGVHGFDKGLTKIMDFRDSKVFDRVQTKYMHC